MRRAVLIRSLRTLSVGHALSFPRGLGRPVLPPIGDEIDERALIMPDPAILVHSILGANIVGINGGLGVLPRFRFFLHISRIGFAFGYIGLSGSQRLQGSFVGRFTKGQSLVKNSHVLI